uniref:Alkaline/neutral invertase n=1 Tax=Chenopodium quinoa TaxID=63459 RepID=A0A803M878_CHEQI
MDEKCERVKESLVADYGDTTIGRVESMDSGFWWIILLKSYVKRTRDHSLADMPEIQQGINLILNLCLSDGFDTFPSLFCAMQCCMIDRWDIYGYPIEIQALFFFALGSAKFMLKEGSDNKIAEYHIPLNVNPTCMDFRWFLLGNCIAILSSLITPQQASTIMDLIEECWDELIGEMPLRMTYPALEGNEWKIITGYESKNTR